MNNLTDNKECGAVEVADRLRGFDSRRLQGEMTDGLAEWHRRRAESDRDIRYYLASIGIVLLMAPCFYLSASPCGYRLADGVSYHEVENIANYMLGK